ncbi:hypothetical protein K2X33_13015 [bacterium]|nr:hypothetical protein [bacterium]
MLALLLSLAVSAQAATPSPTAFAASYYLEQGEYEQALPLWRKLLLADPANQVVFVRVAELQFFVEGRAGLVELFETAITREKIAPATLKRKLRELQSLFVSDKAQNLYLQGKQRESLGDWKGAWESFRRGATADPGQWSLLVARARAERHLGYREAYYQTLQEAQRSFPWDPEQREELALSHYYFRDFDAALALSRGSESLASRSVTALALAESGQVALALPLLRSLASQQGVTPSVFAVLSEIARKQGLEEENRHWSARFLQALRGQSEETWDLYRSAEHKP